MTNSMRRDLATEDYLISEIPVIACFRQDEEVPKPLVILSHGFLKSKEDLKDELKMLADLGYYAVAIDNRGH
jgi:hypothetical protein